MLSPRKAYALKINIYSQDMKVFLDKVYLCSICLKPVEKSAIYSSADCFYPGITCPQIAKDWPGA